MSANGPNRYEFEDLRREVGDLMSDVADLARRVGQLETDVAEAHRAGGAAGRAAADRANEVAHDLHALEQRVERLVAEPRRVQER